MDKIKVKILLRDKSIKQLAINPARKDFEFMGGVYCMDTDLVKLNEKARAELYYYEGNPTPVNIKKEDRSSSYLGYYLKINFIEQVNDVQEKAPGFLSELRGLLTPQVLVGLILGGAVLYSILTSGGV